MDSRHIEVFAQQIPYPTVSFNIIKERKLN